MYYVKAIKGDRIELGNCIQAAFSGGGGGGGVTVEKVTTRVTSIMSTTSQVFLDVTGLTLTKPDITDGICRTTIVAGIDNNTDANRTCLGMFDNGSIVSVESFIPTSSTQATPINLTDDSDADGNVAKGMVYANNGTSRVLYASNEFEMKITSFGVG